MSADRIRMPAGALIVAKTTIRRVGSTRAHTPPESLYFCCHVVTLSHFEYNHLKIYLLCAWQQCDNKNSLAHCCHAVKCLYINAFHPVWQRDNKKKSFSWYEKIEFFLIHVLQCEIIGIGKPPICVHAYPLALQQETKQRRSLYIPVFNIAKVKGRGREKRGRNLGC